MLVNLMCAACLICMTHTCEAVNALCGADIAVEAGVCATCEHGRNECDARILFFNNLDNSLIAFGFCGRNCRWVMALNESYLNAFRNDAFEILHHIVESFAWEETCIDDEGGLFRENISLVGALCHCYRSCCACESVELSVFCADELEHIPVLFWVSIHHAERAFCEWCTSLEFLDNRLCKCLWEEFFFEDASCLADDAEGAVLTWGSSVAALIFHCKFEVAVALFTWEDCSNRLAVDFADAAAFVDNETEVDISALEFFNDETIYA